MAMNIFEKACKLKLRFSTNKGNLTTEDLWDLPLSQLDSLYKGLNKERKNSEEDSLIGEATPENTKLTLQINLIKHVAEVKLKAQEDAKTRSVKAAQVQELKEILASKELDEKKGMSTDDLKKQIAELEG